MKLPEYSNIKEKRDFYHSNHGDAYIVIDTKENFDKFFDGIQDEYIYRGVHDSKYKLFTSAQRAWITNEFDKTGLDFVVFVDRILQNFKSNTLIQRYFSSLHITINDLLSMSFLQHYAAPTPLLDFTSNKYIALYFALDGLKYTASDNDIDNYFSIYLIRLNSELPPADKVFESGLASAQHMLEEYLRNHPNSQVDSSILDGVDNFTAWLKKDGSNDGIHNFRVFYIPNPEVSSFSTRIGTELIWSNMNIIAQNGCFIMNSSDRIPLEKNQYIPILCVDVHKSLSDYIRNKYLASYNRDMIYPDSYNIAKNAFDSFKQSL